MSLKDDLLRKASAGGKFQPSQNVDRRSNPSNSSSPKQETHLDLNSLFSDQGNDNGFDDGSFDSGVEDQQGFEENQNQDYSSQDYSHNDFDQESDQNQEFTIPDQGQDQQQYQDQYSQPQQPQQPYQSQQQTYQIQPQQQFNPYQQGYSQNPFAQAQQQYQPQQQTYQVQPQHQQPRQQIQPLQSYQPVPEDYQGDPEDSATLEERLLLLAKETVLNDIANTFDSQLVTKAALQQLISFYLDNTDSPYTNGSAVLIAVIDEILASDYTQDHYKDLIPMILNSVKDDLSA